MLSLNQFCFPKSLIVLHGLSSKLFNIALQKQSETVVMKSFSKTKKFRKYLLSSHFEQIQFCDSV